GFPDGIAGHELVEKMVAQAARFELETRSGAEVVSMDLAGPVKKISLAGGEVLTADAVILATGARPGKLNVPGEAENAGKGVSYCATCDGPFFRNQEIAVVGGGNTAIQEAVYLTKFASKVTVIHRRDELRATKIVQEQAFANDKIEFVWNSVVTSIDGKNGVEEISLRDNDGKESRLSVYGIFILVGTIPNNEMLPLDQLAMEDGFIITDREMRTNLKGVMAAGDIVSKDVRQVINGAGEGAVAAMSAEHFLSTLG
ncbi:MAG: FAD-dependent oxidoreductase, partial [Proteobacteria bacterium]|nr:FAD-dependent oxidoreductase [Pseudomonadota bacterium]